MSKFTSSPTTLQLGDTVVLSGKTYKVDKCGCGALYALRDEGDNVVFNSGHETLKSITKIVRKEFAKIEQPKSAFKVGQVWKGCNGHKMRIDKIWDDGGVRITVVHNPIGEHQYSEGSPFNLDEDGLYCGRKSDNVSLVELVEDVKPAFKVGDRVRIRSWDSMEKQFGLDREGDIKARLRFTTGMRDLCGKEFTITDFTAHSGTVQGHDFGWNISIDMIELVEAVPVLAVGQKWRTRGGKVFSIKKSEGSLVLEGAGAPGWWYGNHRTGQNCHSPGVLGADHRDTLVELVEDVKPASSGLGHPRDLIELVEDVKPEQPKPEQPKPVVRPGMLIRGLRSVPSVDTVLKVHDARRITAATKSNPDGIDQVVSGWPTDHAVEVRWPWEDDTAWRKVNTPTKKLEPIFKEGEVWRTRRGYLMRVAHVTEQGLGLARVIHAPDDMDREDYEKLWKIHPKGGYCANAKVEGHKNVQGGLLLFGTITSPADPAEWGNNRDDRFAFVEKVSG